MATPAAPSPKTTKRLEYAPPLYRIDDVSLVFHINAGSTRVIATLSVSLRAPPGGALPPLFLHKGPDVQLESAALDGVRTTVTVVEGGVQVQPTAATFTLVTESVIVPEKNTSLEGLYFSSEGMYCTQCEAEGFRSITPFIDRPDNLSIYKSVRIEAPTSFPILLSNGNLIASGPLDHGRHFTTWSDPHPKPSYLFALVAGDLVARSTTFTTRSGKGVDVKLWTRAVDEHKGAWALSSITRAMTWDEERFGLEYDLSLFNVVAVSDFNMGAMENKSLNVFNSRLVMATPESATDLDYGRIEGVIGHEYFHNWTGNRVTCRDWFQLTLKEGLTVYRDHEFSSDLNSRPVQRIDNVSLLRRAQFAEDSGPMAHPVRPDEYEQINNFYSATVYEKGAEVVRMYATLLGRAGFRAGMDLYFARHDGQAVTCDDFYAAMADANASHPAVGDLPALKRWYGQAGTPVLTVSTSYDSAAKTFTLRASQMTPTTPGVESSAKVPVLIPIAVGLLGADGRDMPLTLAPGTAGSLETGGTTAVLRLTSASSDFIFTGVTEKPTPSLLRDFSAPVHMKVEGQSESDLVFLLGHDSDAFNRFEAGQRLGRNALLALYAAAAKALDGSPVLAGVDAGAIEAAVDSACAAAGGLPPALITAFSAVLNDARLDGAFIAKAVSLPSESELLEDLPGGCGDPVLLAAVRAFAVRTLAEGCASAFASALARAESQLVPGAPFSPAFDAAARRALINKVHAYAAAGRSEAVAAAAAARAKVATNMTDEIAAVGCVVDLPPSHPIRMGALDAFAAKWGGDQLVMLKWLSLNACGADATPVVRALLSDKARFHMTNPNSCVSRVWLMPKDGSGYELLASAVLAIDAVNPQVASRIVGAFNKLKKVDAHRQALMRAQLLRMQAAGLSSNVGELVTRALST